MIAVLILRTPYQHSYTVLCQLKLPGNVGLCGQQEIYCPPIKICEGWAP